ncbi:MAG: molybdate ABC transporter substrate-binding protein [Acidobacteriota bacterium]
MRRTAIALLCLAASGLASPSCRAAPPTGLTLYAASSLTQALDEVTAAFRAQSGTAVRTSFAASSTLARQIEAGADADLFVSADQVWMDYLASRGRIVVATRQNVLGNRLALIVPADRMVTIDMRAGFDLAGLLGSGRLAIGDPAHVPAGRYARQALTTLGVWSVAQPKLVPAESVRSALALVERGEVPAGIVYESDALLSSHVRLAGLFPETSHDPIVYPAAIVSGHDRPVVRQLLAFLASPAAGQVFARYHFLVR